MGERERQSKSEFAQLRDKVLVPMVNEADAEFKGSGAHFEWFSEQKATALADQIRTFVQVLYYPKGRSKQNVGLNTASLLFECIPAHGKVRIRQNTQSFRPAPLVEVKELPLSEFNQEAIESAFEGFITKVISKD